MGGAKSDESSDSETTSTNSEDEEVDGWVCCDACNKWRRLPARIAETLKEDTPWTCAQNPNKAWANCSIPQELSTEEIEALELAREEQQEELPDDLTNLLEERARRRRVPAVWQQIRDNVLTNRKRKVQEEDDVMICNCKPTWRGGDGCGPDCINRMLCVECVAGFCPSEDKCTNQVFTKKQYAKLEVRRAGAKGFGLFALEHIPAGAFIIEYIGEVLEEEEYLRRKDFYAEVGQRHYYFMNIGNGEVIDACRKGNRARFINHSCDPNCETQKWLARGELAIGLFALKDIGVGEELTFDYNFERYGDKPIRCYCGSRTCRRFIGGTQDNYHDDSIVPVDPDDASNDWQPIMLTDADMDWATKALLDWRVGVYWEPSKEAAVLNRLEKVCKSRGVPWTPAHYHGTAALPQPDMMEVMAEPAAPAVSAVIKEKEEKKPPKQPVKKAAQQGKDGKHAAKSSKAAAAGEAVLQKLEGLKMEAESMALEQEDKTDAGGWPRMAMEEVKAEDSGGDLSTGVPKEQLKAIDARSIPPHQGAVSAAGRATARKRGSAAAASARTDASMVSTTTAPGAAKAGSRAVGAAGLSSSHASAATGVKDSLLQKRFSGDRGRVDSVGTGTGREDAGEREQAGEGKEAQSRGVKVEEPEPIQAVHSTAARRSTWTARNRTVAKRRSEIDRRLEALVGSSGRLKDASKQNIIKVLRMFNLCDIGPTRMSQRPVPGGRTDSPASDAIPAAGPDGPTTPAMAPGITPGTQPTAASVPQQPVAVLGETDALSVVAPAATAGAAGVDGSGIQPQPSPGVHGATIAELGGPGMQNGIHSHLGTSMLRVPSPALPAPASNYRTVGSQQPIVVTGRQRARMADLSLLLDVILKTSSATLRKEFVACGVLSQLHQAIGRNFSKEYSVILRKILRVLEYLPMTADDLYATRTAHGTLADTLQELSTNQDYDVRTKGSALLKKYPTSACTDPGVVQRLNAPRIRRTGFSPAMPTQNGPAAPGAPAQPARGAPGLEPLVLPPPAGNDPAGLPPLGPHRMGRAPRPPLARGNSNLDLLSPHSIPPSPTLLPPGVGQTNSLLGGPGPQASPMHVDGPSLQGPAQPSPAGDVPQPKRRRRGFSDGPVATPDGFRGGLQGPPMGPSLPRPSPGRPLPYSYFHGSALLDFNRTNAPPPPPLDAEELFELLSVPSSLVRAQPGYQDPTAVLLKPAKAPSDRAHGAPTDVELLFALGVYDTDWAAAAAAARSAPRQERPGTAASTGANARRSKWDIKDRKPGAPCEGDDAMLNDSSQFLPKQTPGTPKLEIIVPEPASADSEATLMTMSPIRSITYSPARPETEAAEVAAMQAHKEANSKAAGPGSNMPYPMGTPISLGFSGLGRSGTPPISNLTMPHSHSYQDLATPNLKRPPGAPSPALTGGPPIMDLHMSLNRPNMPRYPNPGLALRTPTGAREYPPGSPLGPQGSAGMPWQQLASTPRPHSPSTSRLAGPSTGSPHKPFASGPAANQPFAPGPGSTPMAGPTPFTALTPVAGPTPLAGLTPLTGGAAGVTRAQGPSGHTPQGQAGAAPAAPTDPEAAEWTRPMSGGFPDSWDGPDASFDAFVAEAVRFRLGKYVTQPDHPHRITSKEAGTLFKKIHREVVHKERQAYEGRRAQGLFKLIERVKVEANLKEFVRSSIRRFHQQGQQGA